MNTKLTALAILIAIIACYAQQNEIVDATNAEASITLLAGSCEGEVISTTYVKFGVCFTLESGLSAIASMTSQTAYSAVVFSNSDCTGQIVYEDVYGYCNSCQYSHGIFMSVNCFNVNVPTEPIDGLSICPIAPSIPMFSSPYCSGDMTNSLFIDGEWMSFCGSSMQSFIIPPYKTVAIYEQCREDDAMNSVDPKFFTAIQTTNNAGCISFFAEEGEDISQLKISIQFLDDVSQICQEYVDHVEKYCSDEYGCDSKECQDAMQSAEAMKQNCDEYSVTSSLIASSDDDDDERRNNKKQLSGKFKSVNTLSGFRLHTHSIVTTAAKEQLTEKSSRHAAGSQQSSSSSSSSTTTLSYKKFMCGSHKMCEEKQKYVMVRIPLFSLVALLCLCCCCARCCYNKRRERRRHAQFAPAIPYEEDAPERIVVAAVIPMNESGQPQVVFSRLIDPREANQIEADHQFAVQLSKQ